jgi:hypothetical protein
MRSMDGSLPADQNVPRLMVALYGSLLCSQEPATFTSNFSKIDFNNLPISSWENEVIFSLEVLWL